MSIGSGYLMVFLLSIPFGFLYLIRVYLIGKPMTTQSHKKKTYVDVKEVFLVKEWNSFHLYGKKLDYLHPKDVLNHWLHHNARSLLLTAPQTIDSLLEWPLYNPFRDKFPSLFENVLLGSLKSFVQINQQVNVSLYVTEATALCHYRELIGLKPSSCTFIPINLFGFPDYKINFISFSYHTRTLILRQNRPSIHILRNSIAPNSN